MFNLKSNHKLAKHHTHQTYNLHPTIIWFNISTSAHNTAIQPQSLAIFHNFHSHFLAITTAQLYFYSLFLYMSHNLSKIGHQYYFPQQTLNGSSLFHYFLGYKFFLLSFIATLFLESYISHKSSHLSFPGYYPVACPGLIKPPMNYLHWAVYGFRPLFLGLKLMSPVSKCHSIH